MYLFPTDTTRVLNWISSSLYGQLECLYLLKLSSVLNCLNNLIYLPNKSKEPGFSAACLFAMTAGWPSISIRFSFWSFSYWNTLCRNLLCSSSLALSCSRNTFIFSHDLSVCLEYCVQKNNAIVRYDLIHVFSLINNNLVKAAYKARDEYFSIENVSRKLSI